MQNNKHNETIVAIATAPGQGAIGIVRLSGADAVAIVSPFFIPTNPKKTIAPFSPILGDFVINNSINERRATSDERRTKLDQVLLFYCAAPRSYTGEEMIEIHAHGSPVVLRTIVQTLLQAGCRMAEPGEFTKQAFLNGKIDLTQAEAVANLISAKTQLAAQASLAQLEGSLSLQVEQLRQEIVDMFVYVEAAIDYPEEDIELLSKGQLKERAQNLVNQVQSIKEGAKHGKILREGVQVVLVGKTNVGKSSLLNALLNEERAIVTPIPGTTRDVISEYASLEGIPVHFVDTAGIRSSNEVIEQEGIRRSVKRLKEADLILFVCDGSGEWDEEDEHIFKLIETKQFIPVINKVDLLKDKEKVRSQFKKNLKLTQDSLVEISAKNKSGFKPLRTHILNHIQHSEPFLSSQCFMLNLRHEEALNQAEKALKKSAQSLSQDLSGEFIAVDLREALDALGEIVGKTTTDDILNKIFSTFCIGK